MFINYPLDDNIAIFKMECWNIITAWQAQQEESMLNIESITKGFADQVLLEDTGMQINSGERVGLVGRNGHGKTTLLNIIAGIDHPDDGKITYPSGYRLGILPQKIQFSQNSV